MLAKSKVLILFRMKAFNNIRRNSLWWHFFHLNNYTWALAWKGSTRGLQVVFSIDQCLGIVPCACAYVCAHRHACTYFQEKYTTGYQYNCADPHRSLVYVHLFLTVCMKTYIWCSNYHENHQCILIKNPISW